jgi:hypothetical protein
MPGDLTSYKIYRTGILSQYKADMPGVIPHYKEIQVLFPL